MADRFEKFLRKLNASDRELVTSLFRRILVGDFYGLDVKPLKGHKDHFRVRKGRIRIIFLRDNFGIKLVDISNRDDQTYRDF